MVRCYPTVGYGNCPEGATTLLGAIFDRFVARSPVSVMVQGAVEFALNASQLDALFEQHATDQYTRSLLFSSIVDLLTCTFRNIHTLSVNDLERR